MARSTGSSVGSWPGWGGAPGAQNSVEEGDWQKTGGYRPIPVEVKNAVVPGAGDCYLTAMADAKL